MGRLRASRIALRSGRGFAWRHGGGRSRPAGPPPPPPPPGQPVALALNASTPVVASAPAPVDAYMPKATAEVAAASAPVDAGTTALAPVVAAAPAVSTIVFGPRAEIVQPLPVQPAVGSKA